MGAFRLHQLVFPYHVVQEPYSREPQPISNRPTLSSPSRLSLLVSIFSSWFANVRREGQQPFREDGRRGEAGEWSREADLGLSLVPSGRAWRGREEGSGRDRVGLRNRCRTMELLEKSKSPLRRNRPFIAQGWALQVISESILFVGEETDHE